MPTIEEVISKLKENDEEAAGVVSKLLEEKDNFKTQSRRWEDQSKANKEDAEKFRNGNTQGDSRAAELEKQVEALTTEKGELTKQVEEKDTKIDQYEQKESHGKLVSDVAKEKGIPVHLRKWIIGSTKEELEAAADELKQDFKFGNVDDFGNDGGAPKGGTLEAGKDLYEEYSNKK